MLREVLRGRCYSFPMIGYKLQISLKLPVKQLLGLTRMKNSPSFPKTKQNEKNAQKQKKSHEKSPPPILVRGDTNGKVITCSKVQAARRERTRCILYKCTNTLPFVSHSSSFPSTKTSCYRRGKELYGHHANTSKCGRQG